MNSDRNVGNFGPAGPDRVKFVPVEEGVMAAPEARKQGGKAGAASAERREFERIVRAIMGEVRLFPEVLKRVMIVLQAERALLCPI